MGGRFVSESGRPKTEWRPLGAVNCKKQKSLPLYTQIWTGLVNQPHLHLILLKHVKELGKVKNPS